MQNVINKIISNNLDRYIFKILLLEDKTLNPQTVNLGCVLKFKNIRGWCTLPNYLHAGIQVAPTLALLHAVGGSDTGQRTGDL